MLPDVLGAERYRDTRVAFGQIIAEEAGRVRGYELLSAAEVRAVVAQESAKQLMGCDDTGCLAELAERAAEHVCLERIRVTVHDVPAQRRTRRVRRRGIGITGDRQLRVDPGCVRSGEVVHRHAGEGSGASSNLD